MSRYHETIIEEEEEEEEVMVVERRQIEPRSLSGCFEEEEEEEKEDEDEEKEAEEELVLYQPELEDFEINGEGSSGLGVTKKVRFGHVTNYFFDRAQGIDQQPSDGQSPALGMASEHFAEYNERVPLDPKFDGTTLLSDGRRVYKREDTFGALHCEDRRRLLEGAGISRLEWDDIRNVHHFRKVMGCTCRPTCKEWCHCMEGGMPCNANCTCSRPNCGHVFEDLQVLQIETRRKVADRLKTLEAGCSSNERRRKRWLAPDLDGQPPLKSGRWEIVEEERTSRKRKMLEVDEDEQPARKRCKLDERGEEGEGEEEGEAADPPPRAIVEVVAEEEEEEMEVEEDDENLEELKRMERDHKRCMERMLGGHCGLEHIEALRLWSRAKPALTRGLNGVAMTNRQLSVLTKQIGSCMRLLGLD